MKRVKERLKKLTDEILGRDALSEEEFKEKQEELKTLRELIATHKAMAAYENDYGDGDDEPRQKRTSETKWD